MNSVALSGRLANDPEIRINGENKTAKYTLAVRRNFKSQQSVDWINCTAFGRLADNAEKYFKKGMVLNVCGRIQTSTYTNKDGKKIFATEVIVSEQEFGESKKAYEERIAQANEQLQAHAQEPTTPQQPAQPTQPAHQTAQDDWMSIPEGFDEAVPFA